MAMATALAAAIPTSSAPTRPGPTVTATASIPGKATPASSRARSIIGLIASRWAREAISGTTPPNRSWRWAWLDSRLERTVRPSSTTATAVSSQEVSMPSRSIWRSGTDVVRDLADDPLELAPVFRGADVIGPHHHGVLVGLLIVVLADAHRAETDPAVQALGAPVGDPDLERDGPGPVAHRFLDQLVQQSGADLLAVEGGVHGDGGHVGLVAVGHEAAVA